MQAQYPSREFDEKALLGTILWIKKAKDIPDRETYGLTAGTCSHPCVIVDISTEPITRTFRYKICVITSFGGRDLLEARHGRLVREYVPIAPNVENFLSPVPQVRLQHDRLLRKNSWIHLSPTYCVPVTALKKYDREQSVTCYRLTGISLYQLRDKLDLLPTPRPLVEISSLPDIPAGLVAPKELVRQIPPTVNTLPLLPPTRSMVPVYRQERMPLLQQQRRTMALPRPVSVGGPKPPSKSWWTRLCRLFGCLHSTIATTSRCLYPYIYILVPLLCLFGAVLCCIWVLREGILWFLSWKIWHTVANGFKTIGAASQNVWHVLTTGAGMIENFFHKIQGTF